DFAWHRVGWMFPVQRDDRTFDQRRPIGVFGTFGHPAALAPDTPAAYRENLDGHFERIFCQREHVGIGAVPENDRVLFQGLTQRGKIITTRRGTFILLGGGGLVHLAFDTFERLRSLTGDKADEAIHNVTVFVW